MSGPESINNRRGDFRASLIMHDVSEAFAVSSAGKGIAGSSEQYSASAEPERTFDELKTSEDKFRVMVDVIPHARVVRSGRWFGRVLQPTMA